MKMKMMKIRNFQHAKNGAPFLSNKNAQIKIQETAFVLLAIALLAVLLFIFYSRFQVGNIQTAVQAINQETAKSMLGKIAAMPELSCSGLGSENALCIDKDKASILSKAKGYEKFWQNVAKIELVPIYPESPRITIYSGKEGNATYSTFINLCSQKADVWSCAIGKVLITI